MSDGRQIPERRREDARLEAVMRRLDEIERQHTEATDQWGVSQLGPRDKAALPRGVIWYVEKEKVVPGGSGKTGLQILDEVIWNHARSNRMRLILYGSLTPFILVIFGAIVNFIIAHYTPSLPPVTR